MNRLRQVAAQRDRELGAAKAEQGGEHPLEGCRGITTACPSVGDDGYAPETIRKPLDWDLTRS